MKYIRKGKNQKQQRPTDGRLGVAEERRHAKVTGDRVRWENSAKSAREDINAYIEIKCGEMEKDKTDSKAFRILKEVTGKRSARTNVLIIRK